MLFLKIDSPAPVTTFLSGKIKAALDAGKKVLWLVPGGSAIDIAIDVAAELKDSPHLANLSVSLTDERYGAVGHKDSNWQQLEDKGFELKDATALPVLTGESLDQTAKKYAASLTEALDNADYSIALAGMGPDGHILGIKPHSPSVETKELAIGYKWDDFERLTLTFEALKLLDEVVLYVMGHEKWPQFDKLEESIDPSQQPAQLLKKLKKVTIFNDYKEKL